MRNRRKLIHYLVSSAVVCLCTSILVVIWAFIGYRSYSPTDADFRKLAIERIPNGFPVGVEVLRFVSWAGRDESLLWQLKITDDTALAALLEQLRLKPADFNTSTLPPIGNFYSDIVGIPRWIELPKVGDRWFYADDQTKCNWNQSMQHCQPFQYLWSADGKIMYLYHWFT